VDSLNALAIEAFGKGKRDDAPGFAGQVQVLPSRRSVVRVKRDDLGGANQRLSRTLTGEKSDRSGWHDQRH